MIWVTKKRCRNSCVVTLIRAQNYPGRGFSASILLMALLLMGGNVFGDSNCSPFGNPPAVVSGDWFARVVTAGNSVCVSGRRLGPWTDGNGDPRYACLYEPPHREELAPLP